MGVLGGATATILKGRGSLQDIDQLALMRPITRWASRVTKVADLAPAVDRAFRVATEDVPGPVFLEIPVDLLYPREVVERWYVQESGVERMKGPAGRAARAGLQLWLKRIFDMPHLALPGGGQPDLPSPRSTARVLDAVAADLRKARRPVLVVGSQAMVHADADRAERIAQAVRRLGLPTYLAGSARGLLGPSDPLWFRHKRSKALREADFVLVAGMPFDFRMAYGRSIPRKACVAAANLDPVALRKNRRPTHAILDHPGDVLLQLAERVGGDAPDRGEWLAALREREAARDEEIAAKARTEGPLVDPIHLFQRMDRVLQDDAILVMDGGDFVATGAYILRPRRPLSWLDPGVFGTLGVGGGFAAGAAAARPDAPVWIVWGDGASAWSLAEFDTFVRHGMAPIAVIGTDASWQQIARDQVRLLGDDVGTVLRRTDYHVVAEGYGGVGLLLDDPGRVDETLAEAIRLQQAGRPVCINVHLAPSDFREGSISI